MRMDFSRRRLLYTASAQQARLSHGAFICLPTSGGNLNILRIESQ